MKKILLLIAVVVASPLVSSAHVETNDSLKINASSVALADSTVSKEKRLQTQNDSLKNVIDDLQEQIKGYKARLEVGDIDKQKNARTIKDKDKTLEEREQIIKSKAIEIQSLKNAVLSSDTVIITLLNTCLYYPYTEKAVDRAIKKFDKIHSGELRNNVGRLKYLLDNYGLYDEELRNLFSDADSDKDGLTNFFTGKVKAKSYIGKIKSSRYYRECYNDKNWTIPYLNTVVDKAIKILNSYDPKEKKPLSLLQLLGK